MLKKFPLDKINGTQKFYNKSYHNLRFLYELCVGFSIFDSVLFLLKFMFLFNKINGLFDFKTS